jgi:hypothetical protein
MPALFPWRSFYPRGPEDLTASFVPGCDGEHFASIIEVHPGLWGLAITAARGSLRTKTLVVGTWEDALSDAESTMLSMGWQPLPFEVLDG